MENIRPVSELRNNFTDISRIIKESNEPMILTKNGYAEMVVLSAEAFENHNFHIHFIINFYYHNVAVILILN